MAEHVPALVSTGPRSRAASAAAALRTCGAGLRWFAGTPGPGLLAVAVALAACTSSSAPPQPQTARVERTTVFTAVSSSGALSASSEQNLGFLRGGRLTAVNVKVGDRVTAGQVLANLDDGPARRTLEQQQAQLDAQRAVLDRLVNSTTVTGAQNSVEQAQAILDATEDQVDATLDADESALDRAQRQLDFDEDARDDAEDQLDADEKACAASTGMGTATTGTFTFPFTPASTVGRDASAPGTTSRRARRAADTGARPRAQSPARPLRRPTPTAGTAGTRPGTPPAPAPGDPPGRSPPYRPARPLGSGACSRVLGPVGGGHGRPAGRGQPHRPRRGPAEARRRRGRRPGVDRERPPGSGERAEQPRLGGHGPPVDHRPAAGPGRRQDAVVRQAQQDVDETVLRAPVDGTVAALNGAVAEYVAASSGTSALAPAARQ